MPCSTDSTVAGLFRKPLLRHVCSPARPHCSIFQHHPTIKFETGTMPAGVEQCIAAAGVGSNKGLHHSRSDPEFHDSESTTDHTHVASANQWGDWKGARVTRAACLWLQYAVSNWDTISVKHKPGHLDQALLYKDSCMEVMLHKFAGDGVQSVIHNHRASFVTTCLSGSYTESRWLVGSYVECQRNALGKLGSPVLCRGHLSLLKTELLTAGQSRACLHHDIHSIRCNRGDAPVTLVVRHKDQCAMTRVTNFFMPDDEVANDGSWNVAWEDDRPCSHTEKTSMLKVLKDTAAPFRADTNSACRRDSSDPTYIQWHKLLVQLTYSVMWDALQSA